MSRISSRDDVIDTRMVLDRIEELEAEHLDEDTAEVILAPGAWEDGDLAEYDSLRALIAECESETEYERQLRDGITLVRESHWGDYAKDWYADTWGNPWIKRNRYGDPEYDQVNHHYVGVSWSEVMDTEPFKFIDWEAAAEDLRSERTEIEWEGVAYIFG